MGLLQKDSDHVGGDKVAMRDAYEEGKDPMLTFVLTLIKVPVVVAGIVVGALVAHGLVPMLARIIAKNAL